MRKIKNITSSLSIAAISLVSFGSHAATNLNTEKNKNAEQDRNSPFLREFTMTSIPMGHAQFCESYAADCAQRSDKVYRMRLTPERWDQLVKVNNEINQRIEAKTDMDAYAVEEFWTYPSNIGDCEDFALLKRKILIDEMGWHHSTLRMAVVLDENDEGHAVLMASTDQGDLILDNMRDEILSWRDVDYTYIKRQSGFDSSVWVSLRTSPIRTAKAF